MNLFGFVVLDLWRRTIHEGIASTLWLKLDLARHLHSVQITGNPTRLIHIRVTLKPVAYNYKN